METILDLVTYRMIPGLPAHCYDMCADRNDHVDNALIAPIISVYRELTSVFELKLDEWHELPLTTRHLYLGISALHKAVRKDINTIELPNHQGKSVPMSQELRLLHYHQACAAQELNQRLKTVTPRMPDLDLLFSIQMFMYFQMQQGAYSQWRAHIDGAHMVSSLWGAKSLLGSDCDYSYYALMTINVFGSATTPSHALSQKIVQQHLFYLEIQQSLIVDIATSTMPVPREIVTATAMINILRAGESHDAAAEVLRLTGVRLDAVGILEYIHGFSSSSWAESLSPVTVDTAISERAEGLFMASFHAGWALFADCYQAAVLLYLSWKHPADRPGAERNDGVDWSRISENAYNKLKSSLHEVFDRRIAGVTHKNFVFWPMSIAGVEAVKRHDRQHLDSLERRLMRAAINTGGLAGRDAILFLEELWEKTHSQPAEAFAMSWDDIFESAPLFLE